MSHDRFHGAAEIRRHEGPLPRGALPPRVANLRGQLDYLTLAHVHPNLVVLDISPSPGDLTRQALAGKGAPWHGEVPGWLAIAVHACQSPGVVVEGIGTA